MKKVFGILFAAVFAICLYSAFSPTQADAAALGKINMSAILQSYPDVQSANAALDMEREKMQEEFNKKASSLDENGKKALFDKLNQKFIQRENELFTPIKKTVQQAISSVAKEKGIDMVVYSEAVAYGGDDITQAVIQKLKK